MNTKNSESYYLFDYDPADELKIRERIRELQETNTMLKFGYELVVYDLYELILHLLQERGYSG